MCATWMARLSLRLGFVEKLVLAIAEIGWYNRHMKDLELMGDALEEVTQAQVFEAMADESELGDADINAWAEMWLAKENA